MTGALLFAAILVALGARADAGQGVHGDPVRGKLFFMKFGCYACHGTTGAGGGFAGPKIAPDPPPLEAVQAKLRTAGGRMPVYAPVVLDDAKVADIVAYLRSIPRGRSAREIPELNR